MKYREDDIITCERGHPVYRMARDRDTGDHIMAADLESLVPSIPQPAPHRAATMHCPRCGQPVFRNTTLGGIAFHFEDGWR